MTGRDYTVYEPWLPGVAYITAIPYRDERGENFRVWERAEFEKGTRQKLDFIEDDISVSRRGVLRGIHVDDGAWKLLACLHGSIFLAVADCRTASETYGRWHGWFLDAGRRYRQQVLVPPGFGVAHLVMSEAILHYKMTMPYDLSRQRTYRYDAPGFNITWPPVQAQPILSPRDQEGDVVAEVVHKLSHSLLDTLK